MNLTKGFPATGGAPTMDGQRALCITFQACCPCAQVYNHNFLWTVYCHCLSHAQWGSYALDDNCLSHPRRCFYAQEILLKFCWNLPAKRLTHHLHDLWHSPSEGNGSSIHVLYITKISDQSSYIISLVLSGCDGGGGPFHPSVPSSVPSSVHPSSSSRKKKMTEEEEEEKLL
jgi:hypothetical protein